MENESEFAPPNSKQEALGFDSEHLLRTENIPFDIDNWYPRIADFTFETAFLPLSRSEARAIVRYHWHVHMARGQFTTADATHLEALEARIDEAIETNPQLAASGVFMRLCGRSPKDADPLDRERVRREYCAALDSIAHEQKGPSVESNTQGVDTATTEGASVNELEQKMLAAARVGVMRCHTGADVMSLLLSSERVYSDMLDWLWYGEPEQVVLRAWEPNLSLDFEFRLYVHEGKLTAISQYDHYVRYSHLFALKGMLQRRMIELWTQIHPRIGVESYGMDLVYLKETDEFKCLELSPFLRCTGAHCFRWGKAEDVDVLEGRAPFEFRLVETTVPNFSSMFATGWDQRWAPVRDTPPFWTHYQTTGRRWALDSLRFARRLSRNYGGLKIITVVAAAATVAAAVFLGPRLTDHELLLKYAGSTAIVAGLIASVAKLSQPSNAFDGTKSSQYLFVYGTLKRGMQWHSKFLSFGATYVGRAHTKEFFPLVVGSSGVPYLLYDMIGEGHSVQGELYLVESDTLHGLDEYEGVSKSYYARPEITVCAENMTEPILASVYCMMQSPSALRKLPPLIEYTIPLHRQRYRACEHIELKQKLYLAGKTPYTHRGARHPAISVASDAQPPRMFTPIQPHIVNEE